MRADFALQGLVNGNQRFVSGWALHPNQDRARRQQLLAGQHPDAIVLCCSDSRVVPNIVFDAGLGELFVIRVAGNVATSGAVGSIEFAVAELGCELCLVLGHTSCGAIKAAVAGEGADGEIGGLVELIEPACAAARDAGESAPDAVSRHNVRQQVEELKARGPILVQRVAQGRLKVVGALYDLATGEVEFFD